MVHFPAILVFCSFTFTPDVKGVQGPMTKCDQKITTEKKKQKKQFGIFGTKKSRCFFLNTKCFTHFWGGGFYYLGTWSSWPWESHTFKPDAPFCKRNKGLAKSTRKRILASVVNSDRRSDFHQILFVYII